MPTRVWAALEFDNPANFWQRTTVGLVLREQFARPDSDTVGSGWTEVEPGGVTDIQISSEELALNNAGVQYIHRTTPATPSTFILQANGRVTGAGYIELFARSDRSVAGEGSATEYRVQMDDGNNRLRVEERNSGASTQSDDDVGTDPGSSNRSVRLVLSGGTTIEGFMSDVLASLQDLSEPLTVSSTSITDVTPSANTEYGVGSSGTAVVDELLMYGRQVIVNDLPLGWKVRLDGDSPVVEISGVATVDVDTRNMPATRLFIQDSNDVVQQELVPSGGVFGGAIFDNVINPGFPGDGIRELDSRSVSKDGAGTDLSGGAEYQAQLVTSSFDMSDATGGLGVLGEVVQNVEQRQGCDVEITPVIDGKEESEESLIRTKVAGDPLPTHYGFHSRGRQGRVQVDVRNFNQEAAFHEVELGKAEWNVTHKRRHE